MLLNLQVCNFGKSYLLKHYDRIAINILNSRSTDFYCILKEYDTDDDLKKLEMKMAYWKIGMNLHFYDLAGNMEINDIFLSDIEDNNILLSGQEAKVLFELFKIADVEFFILKTHPGDVDKRKLQSFLDELESYYKRNLM